MRACWAFILGNTLSFSQTLTSFMKLLERTLYNGERDLLRKDEADAETLHA